MVSAGFCFGGETETRGRKRSRLKGLNVGKKAKRGQKVLCKGQKCPRKGGERKESHYWPDPQTHCKRRGVQPGMTDVPGHCFPLQPPRCLLLRLWTFHETASAWPSQSARLACVPAFPDTFREIPWDVPAFPKRAVRSSQRTDTNGTTCPETEQQRMCPSRKFTGSTTATQAATRNVRQKSIVINRISNRHGCGYFASGP